MRYWKTLMSSALSPKTKIPQERERETAASTHGNLQEIL